MSENIEKTGKRSLELSRLLREVPAPAGHIDWDGAQFCRHCLEWSMVSEWTTSDKYKHTYLIEDIARKIGVRALLFRTGSGPIESVEVSDLPRKPIKLTRAELVKWLGGLRMLHCTKSNAHIGSLRYPGAKGRFVKQILKRIPLITNFIEPFVGSGAVAGALLAYGWPLKSVWLNDADIGVASFWKVLHQGAKELIEKTLNWEPTVESFYKLRDMSNPTTFDLAWQTLALSYTSFGAMRRSPIGGATQKSAYSVGCRWNGARIAKSLDWWTQSLSNLKVKITCEDAIGILDRTATFAYLDPPYVEQGEMLYEQTVDHEALAQCLAKRGNWLLSLDQHDNYSGRQINQIARRKTSLGDEYTELLIGGYK